MHRFDVTRRCSRISRSKWRLREFFGRKSTFFSIYLLKNPAFSGDYFDDKVMVIRWPDVKKKRIESRNKLQLLSDAINDVIMISHTGNKSPWSEFWIPTRPRDGALGVFEVLRLSDHVLAWKSHGKENFQSKNSRSRKCELNPAIISFSWTGLDALN